ncbi:MAG: asparagine synthase (glutamine-hydrolyzing) [Verrucomicrobiota bacterium]|nr:asparagine synthase (glutamine-hydrolyzing) [Verrucomicrobiota bacterium]
MCGIFGFCGFAGRTLPAMALRACTRLMKHRGPDGQGDVGWTATGDLWREGSPAELALALGHRRLAIFDLSSAGAQPMRDSRGRWIVFNGEIYNFQELRRDLEAVGYGFSSGTDTEVILAAYDRWGTDCVKRFNGMWAFALYDPGRKGLFCNRDRLGVKPFYYARQPNAFCFASEVGPIFTALNKPVQVDRGELARYLVSDASDDGPNTLYRGILELRGGHTLWLDTDSGESKLWRYWDLPEEPDLDMDDGQVLDRFSEILEDAVRLRLRADVPVAITLSGGIDSSAVTVAARRSGGGRLVTFTSHFPGAPEIDETPYASEVAKMCGAEHILVAPDLSKMVEEEPALTLHQAMPYWSLSMYVLWAIVKEVRAKGIPVALSGQGGDELFMGYERYYAPYVLGFMPNLARVGVELVRCGRRSRLGVSRMLVYALVFGWPWLRRAIRLRSARNGFAPELFEPPPRLSLRSDIRLRNLQRDELQGRQLSQLLRYDDRIMGARGMEERQPFLDYRMVEFAWRLPWRHKIRDGWTKYLARRYLDRHGLATIAWRRHKLGFNAPQRLWLGQLIARRGAVLEAQPFARALLRPGRGLADLSEDAQWDAYLLLQLAHLMGWEGISPE